MKFELWRTPGGASYTLVRELHADYEFLTKDSELVTTFTAESVEDAMQQRDAYLGWT